MLSSERSEFFIPSLHQTPSINLYNVTLRRSGRALIDQLTWVVPQGTCCAVLGPNGAGKSTLLAIICGYLWPQEGSVEVLGARYGQVDLTLFRRRMGVLGLSRIPEFHEDATALETVLAGFWGAIVIPIHCEPTQQQIEQAMDVLHHTGVAAYAQIPFGALSSGERMRVLLARALVSNPEILILDEPTSAMDIAGRAMFVEALDRIQQTHPKLTVILTTHYVEDLPRQTQHALILAQGRAIAAGPIQESMNSDTLSQAFGRKITLQCADGQFWIRVHRQ